MSAKKLTGRVVSKKTDKTVIVETVRSKSHPLYRKQYKINKRYAVHDEKNEANLGDKVEIMEIKPQSKTKRFGLTQVVEKAQGSEK